MLKCSSDMLLAISSKLHKGLNVNSFCQNYFPMRNRHTVRMLQYSSITGKHNPGMYGAVQKS